MMKHSRTSTIFLFLGMTALCAVLLELAVRRFAPLPDPYDGAKYRGQQHTLIRSQWPRNLRFRTQIEPGLPGMSGEHMFSTNNVGFRGEHLAIPKPANEYRVFMVGGSSVECSYLDDRESIDYVLQAYLRQNMKDTRVVRVYNAGKSGDKSDDHVAMIVHRLVHLAPDMIILQAGINDLTASIANYDYLSFDNTGYYGRRRVRTGELFAALATEWQLPRHGYYLWKRIAAKSDTDVYQELDSRSNYAEKVRRCGAVPISDQAPRADVSAYRANLTTIAGLAKAHGFPLVFVTQATSWNAPAHAAAAKWHWMACRAGVKYREDRLDSALESFNDAMREVGRQQGVPVFDLARMTPKSADGFYDDVHFNVSGASRAGQNLGRFLVEFLGEEGARVRATVPRRLRQEGS